MGESAKSISDDFKSDSPEINWKGITGMRDKRIHGYFSVDPEIVWETIQKKDFLNLKIN